MKRLLLIFAFALLCTFSNLFAQVPRTLNYQGVLVDNSGTPLQGTKNLYFEFYENEVGGSVLQTVSTSGVTVDKFGYFNVILEGLQDIFAGERWVQIYVDNVAIGARVRLTSVPYAMNAEAANKALKSDTATYAVTAGTAGYALKADTANYAIPYGSASGPNSDLDGTFPNNLKIKESVIQGLISSVLGPADGDLNGTYPLLYINQGAVLTKHIADKNVTTGKLADGAVTTVKIADGAVTADKVDASIATQAELDAATANLTTLINNEATTRTTADATETAARIAADNALTTAYLAADATETAARIAADNALTTAYQTADATETAARIAADDALTTAYQAADATEATARIAADDLEVTNRTAAIATEAASRQSNDDAIVAAFMQADADLNTAITAETTARTTADAALTTAYEAADAAEVTARTAADALKLDKALPTGQIFVGDANSLAAPQTMTGDVTINYNGFATISADAVTSEKIADGAVGNSELASGAVTNDKITSGTITNNKLNAANITTGKFLMSDGNGNVIWNDGNLTLPYSGTYSPSTNLNGFLVRRTYLNASALSTAAIYGVNEDVDGFAGHLVSTQPTSTALKVENSNGGMALEVVGNTNISGSTTMNLNNGVFNVYGTTGNLSIAQGKILGEHTGVADAPKTLTTKSYVDNEIINATDDMKTYGYLTAVPEADLVNSKSIAVSNSLTLTPDDNAKTMTVGLATAGVTANEIADGTITNAEMATATKYATIQDANNNGFDITEGNKIAQFVGSGTNKVIMDATNHKLTIDGKVTTDNTSVVGDGAATAIALNMGNPNVWTATQTFDDVQASTATIGQLEVATDAIVGGDLNLIGNLNGYQVAPSPFVASAKRVALSDIDNKWQAAQTFLKNDDQKAAFVNSINYGSTTPNADQLSASVINVDGTTVYDNGGELAVKYDGSTINLGATGLYVVGSALTNLQGTNIAAGTIPVSALDMSAGQFANWDTDKTDDVNLTTPIASVASPASDITLSGTVASGLTLQYNAKSITYSDIADNTILGDNIVKSKTGGTQDELWNINGVAPKNLVGGMLVSDALGNPVYDATIVDFSNWEKKSSDVFHKSTDRIQASVASDIVINPTNLPKAGSLYNSLEVQINPTANAGARMATAINASTSRIDVENVELGAAGTVLASTGTANSWTDLVTLINGAAATSKINAGKLYINAPLYDNANSLDLRLANTTLYKTGLAGSEGLAVNPATDVAWTAAQSFGAAINANGVINANATIVNTTAATPVTIADDLAVTGGATVATTLGVTGATTLGNTLGVTGATTLGNTLSVTGATTLNSTLNVTGAIANDGVLSNANVVAINDDATIAGKLDVGGVVSAPAGANIGGVLFNNSGIVTGVNSIVAGAATIGSATITTASITNLNNLSTIATTGSATIGGDLFVSQYGSQITGAMSNLAAAIANAPGKTIYRYAGTDMVLNSSDLQAATAPGRVIVIVNETSGPLSICGATVNSFEAIQLISVNNGTANVWYVIK